MTFFRELWKVIKAFAVRMYFVIFIRSGSDGESSEWYSFGYFEMGYGRFAMGNADSIDWIWDIQVLEKVWHIRKGIDVWNCSVAVLVLATMR